MNAILSRYLPIAEALAALAIVASVAFGFHQYSEHEREIGRQQVRAEYAQQLADAKDAARKVEDDWRTRYDTAIQQGVTNEKTLRIAAAAAAASSGSLRDTIAELRNRLPGATAEASRAYAATLAGLLESCKEEYRQVGQDAQGYANDSATLSAAWPTSPPPAR